MGKMKIYFAGEGGSREGKSPYFREKESMEVAIQILEKYNRLYSYYAEPSFILLEMIKEDPKTLKRRKI